MQIFGQIHFISETKSFNEGKFTTRIVYIKTVEQYSQTIPIQFEKDNISKLDSFQVGDLVKIDFNLRGKEFTKQDGTKDAFITLAGWKIEKN